VAKKDGARMGLFSKRRELVGLDIGAHAVKAVQLGRTRSGYELVHLGTAPLGPDAIVEGMIMDSNAVIGAIQEVFKEREIKTKTVAVAVSGHHVIIKPIRITRVSEKELEGAIQWEAEQHIPYAIEDVNIDFQVLPTAPPDSTEMDVLLVAVKKEIINDYIATISTADLIPQVVDVETFALENVYTTFYESVPDEVVALVNLGAAITNINILRNGVSEFRRDSPIGGNRYTESIQKMLGLSFEQAEALKLGSNEVEGLTFADAKTAIDMVSAELAGDIRRSFDFFRSTAHTDTLHKVLVSGGCARLPGLDAYLSEALEVPFEVLDPLKDIKFDPAKFDPEYLKYISPQLAVAVGLALREADD
jgi:type IV pilus assembly protein PilM